MVWPSMTNKSFETAFALEQNRAVQKVENLARMVLATNEEYEEFVLGMGSWFFTKAGCPVFNIDDYFDMLNGKGPMDLNQRATQSLLEIGAFFERWDEVYHMSGHPMRFTAKGKVVYDW